MPNELGRIVGGEPLEGNLQGFIHNAVGKLEDGWNHSGGQAGVHLNLKHSRAHASYAADQQFRNELRKYASRRVPGAAISDQQEGRPGNTGARAIRARPATGRKTFVSALAGGP